MVRALLWDNDGVLVDSETLFFETTQSVFFSFGLKLDDSLWRDRYLGRGAHSVDIAQMLGATAQKAHEVVAHRNMVFWQRLEQPVALRPSIAQTLAKLHSLFRMGVVTSAPRRQFDLLHAHTGLRDYFECIITADDCSKIKPDPEPYFTALQCMGLPPEECLAIEDSPRGLASAAAAGIRCVVIQTALTDLSACDRAFAIIENAHELDTVLQTISPSAN
ncbi:MAG: HAD family phosphatase [Desulfobacteraceae bacterium]|nr:HAD family phosphatase [Desulfobacteraceae bacterium]